MAAAGGWGCIARNQDARFGVLFRCADALTAPDPYFIQVGRCCPKNNPGISKDSGIILTLPPEIRLNHIYFSEQHLSLLLVPGTLSENGYIKTRHFVS